MRGQRYRSQIVCVACILLGASMPGCDGVTSPALGSSPLQGIDGDGEIVILVFGDSNSMVGWPWPNWCEQLRDGLAPPAWHVTCKLPYGLGTSSAVRGLEKQIAVALDVGEQFDVAIFAYGTNDIYLFNASSTEIIAAYERERRRLAPRPVFFATTPHRREPASKHNPAIDELNTQLAEAIPACRLIDFHSGLDAGDYADHVHFSEQGHHKRAQRALRAIRAAAEAGGCFTASRRPGRVAWVVLGATLLGGLLWVAGRHFF